MVTAAIHYAVPLPEPAFDGKIGTTYLDSKGSWPKLPAPPEGAPNIVIILLDDVGFGQVSTFGGPVPTPNLDKLAERATKRGCCSSATYPAYRQTSVEILERRGAVLLGCGEAIPFGSSSMLARFFRSFVSVAAMSSILTGCAHYSPEPLTASNHDVVDVRGEHPTLNHLSEICRDRDLLCILAGFAILGGTIAVIKGSED